MRVRFLDWRTETSQKRQKKQKQKPNADRSYGYRGRDCRSNLHLLPTGEMVYFIAAVVVLYNVDEQQQRHYLGHTDDVKWLFFFVSFFC